MRSRAAPRAPSPIPLAVRLQVRSLQRQAAPQVHSLLLEPPALVRSLQPVPSPGAHSLQQEPPVLVH